MTCEHRLISNMCSVNPLYIGRSSIVICWTSSFVILGVSDLFCHFYSIFDEKIMLANNVDPDQMPHNVASDLGLHCLPKYPL